MRISGFVGTATLAPYAVVLFRLAQFSNVSKDDRRVEVALDVCLLEMDNLRTEQMLVAEGFNRKLVEAYTKHLKREQRAFSAGTHCHDAQLPTTQMLHKRLDSELDGILGHIEKDLLQVVHGWKIEVQPIRRQVVRSHDVHELLLGNCGFVDNVDALLATTPDDHFVRDFFPFFLLTSFPLVLAGGFVHIFFVRTIGHRDVLHFFFPIMSPNHGHIRL
ncbi:hypothetical protein VTN31DRAFT_2639 [Thermomyces dupontii]|uniref:uncharacterized protein n=1 Tax=Talaromyces thermophilus TaxID=28565 RepID=UPI00374297EA